MVPFSLTAIDLVWILTFLGELYLTFTSDEGKIRL